MLAKAILVTYLVWMQTAISQNVPKQIVVTSQPPPDLPKTNETDLDFNLENLLVEEIKKSALIQQQELNTISELERINLLLENRTRIQNDELQSFAKLLAGQNEQLKKLQTKIQELNEKLLPKNCKDIKKNGNNESGVYRINPNSDSQSFEVWCDMDTKGGGWIYVVNRFDGSQKFNLNWTDYKNGFGNLSGEFWLGLDHLYELTNAEHNELLIELTDWSNKTVYANYKKFLVGDEGEGYKLKSVRDYTGDEGDDFGAHEGMKFSTPDKSQDNFNAYCAGQWDAGWWYTTCYSCFLTGQYNDRTKSKHFRIGARGINSFYFHGYGYSLQKAKMMIRPLS